MAKTKELTIGYGRTVNPKQYCPERFDLTARVELEPGDDENEVVSGYYEWLKEQVDAMADAAMTRENG
jgi:hypothetical protein